jgi:hypothetical protein
MANLKKFKTSLQPPYKTAVWSSMSKIMHANIKHDSKTKYDIFGNVKCIIVKTCIFVVLHDIRNQQDNTQLQDIESQFGLRCGSIRTSWV